MLLWAFHRTPVIQAQPGHNVEPGFFLEVSMSRSRKKHPITGMTTAETEKEFKQQEHQRERANIRTALANFDADAEPLPHPKEFGDPWNGPKDGKRIRKEDTRKARRK